MQQRDSKGACPVERAQCGEIRHARRHGNACGARRGHGLDAQICALAEGAICYVAFNTERAAFESDQEHTVTGTGTDAHRLHRCRVCALSGYGCVLRRVRAADRCDKDPACTCSPRRAHGAPCQRLYHAYHSALCEFLYHSAICQRLYHAHRVNSSTT